MTSNGHTGYPANAAQPEQFAITSSTTSFAAHCWEQTFLQCWNHPVSEGETASDLLAWRSSHGKAEKMSHGTSPSPTLSQTPTYKSQQRVQEARRKGGQQKGNQVRSSRPLVHLHSARFRNLRTNQRQGTKFFQELGRRLRTISDDPRESAFLRQRISITLQRFNAITFSDTFTSASETELEA